MKINKILNNNYVTSYNDDTGEIVVMGPGVGFRKKAGNTIDNYKIEKIYQREPMHRISKMDGITFRDYLKKGEGKQSYLVPKRSCNYDLPENRWLKKIITF